MAKAKAVATAFRAYKEDAPSAAMRNFGSSWLGQRMSDASSMPSDERARALCNGGKNKNEGFNAGPLPPVVPVPPSEVERLTP